LMQGFTNRLLWCQPIRHRHYELVICSQVWIGLLFHQIIRQTLPGSELLSDWYGGGLITRRASYIRKLAPVSRKTGNFDWHFHCLGTLYASEQLVLSAAKIRMVTDTSYLGPGQFCKFDRRSSSTRWTIDNAKVGMEANGFF